MAVRQTPAPVPPYASACVQHVPSPTPGPTTTLSALPPPPPPPLPRPPFPPAGPRWANGQPPPLLQCPLAQFRHGLPLITATDVRMSANQPSERPFSTNSTTHCHCPPPWRVQPGRSSRCCRRPRLPKPPRRCLGGRSATKHGPSSGSGSARCGPLPQPGPVGELLFCERRVPCAVARRSLL